MDGRIVKAILCSCETATKDLENSEDYQTLVKEEKFLPKSTVIFNALCLSLTKLLCYKVSKEAYQRYTVRLHIIDSLRDLCRITDTLKDLRVFTVEKHASTFVENLLEKYLTKDILDNCTSDDSLLPLIKALICLASKSSYYECHIEKLLVKLSQLECSDESCKLLCYVVHKDFNLNLKLSTIEQIYHSQRCKLIEQPLLNNFISTCTHLNKINNTENSESAHLIDQLLEITIKSPFIFQLICLFLKELLIHLDYAPTVLDFIQSIISQIAKYCEEHDKNILDLYPKYLQSCIILLRIEPSYHTIDSKETTLKMLKNIHMEDTGATIILLAHFPVWLKMFGEYLTKNMNHLDQK